MCSEHVSEIQGWGRGQGVSCGGKGLFLLFFFQTLLNRHPPFSHFLMGELFSFPFPPLAPPAAFRLRQDEPKTEDKWGEGASEGGKKKRFMLHRSRGLLENVVGAPFHRSSLWGRERDVCWPGLLFPGWKHYPQALCFGPGDRSRCCRQGWYCQRWWTVNPSQPRSYGEIYKRTNR